MSDEEFGPVDVEDVEDKLEALADEARKKQRSVKYHILRRQMTPKGAPHRKLTWDTIEQIRYLKQEQPEEWTVERLAQGFSVTPDVILRVLKSKFIPPPERKTKQDAKVMAGLGQQVLPSGVKAGKEQPKLPGNLSLAKSPAPVTALPTKFTAGVSRAATVTRSTEEGGHTSTNPPEEDREGEESWDGQVLTEEELEELMEIQKAIPPVVQ
ncbi:hypothetical protein INR49_000619, partial [Caranx melampygus]